MRYALHFDHWSVRYASGVTRYVKSEESAKIEALSNPDVIGIKGPLFAD